MGIKEFWKVNKSGYLWSCLGLILGALFIGAVKQYDMTATSLFILAAFPVMFIFAYGLYEFTGGDK
jgi:hypothetical protein